MLTKPRFSITDIRRAAHFPRINRAQACSAPLKSSDEILLMKHLRYQVGSYLDILQKVNCRTHLFQVQQHFWARGHRPSTLHDIPDVVESLWKICIFYERLETTEQDASQRSWKKLSDHDMMPKWKHQFAESHLKPEQDMNKYRAFSIRGNEGLCAFCFAVKVTGIGKCHRLRRGWLCDSKASKPALTWSSGPGLRVGFKFTLSCAACITIRERGNDWRRLKTSLSFHLHNTDLIHMLSTFKFWSSVQVAGNVSLRYVRSTYLTLWAECLWLIISPI